MIAGQLEIQLYANVARIAADMDKAKSTVNSAMGSIDRATGVAMKALGALGIGLSVNYFGRLVKGAIDAQDELAKMAQRTGVSVQGLAGLQHAANLSGASLDTIQKGLKTVSQQMLDAQRGLKTSKENFDALGISVLDSNGALRQADQVMIDVADRFAQMKDGTEKTALATKLFGRAGLELIPMLNEGSAGLAAMVREGQRFNPVTEESAKQAEIFNDNMERLSKTFGAYFIESVNKALPVLASWTEHLLGAVNASNELLAAQDKQLAQLGTLSASAIAADIQATSERIEAKRKEILITEGVASQTGLYQDKLRILNLELDSESSYIRVLQAQLEKLRNGYVPVVEVTEDLSGATETLTEDQIKAAEQAEKLREANEEYTQSLRDELRQLDLTGRALAHDVAMLKLNAEATDEVRAEVIRLTDALFERNEATRQQEEFEKLATEAVAEHMKAQADAAKEAARIAEKQAADNLRVQSDMWKRIDDTAQDAFVSIADGGRDAFERLEDSLKSGLYALLYEMTMKKWVINIAAGVSGQGVAQSAFGSAAGGIFGNVAGGIAGGGGLMAAGSQFMGGLTGGAIGTNSMIATGASTTGAGISAAVAAIPVWGWALMATAIAAKMLAKEETPSFNAGLLLERLPGIKGQFDTEQFDSGLDVSGFTRRSSQADAEKVIDLFRNVDATFTKLSEAAGYEVNLNRGNFTGLDERGLGNGLFLGTAGESGDPVTNLQQQIDTFALQWINAIRDQLSPADYESIIAAGGAEAMAIKYKEIVTEQTKALEVSAKDQARILTERMRLQDEYDNLTMTGTELLAKQRDALDESNRALFDQVTVLRDVKKVTQETTALQERLNGLTMSRNQQLWAERQALDESNRGLFDEVTAIQTAAAAREAAFAAVDVAMAGVIKAVETERDLVTKAYKDSTKTITDSLSKLTSLAGVLKSTLNGMLTIERGLAQSQLAGFLATARSGGGLPTVEQINPTLAALSRPSEGMFSSLVDYQRDLARTTNDIAELASITDGQIDMAETQLDVLKATYEGEMLRLDKIIDTAQMQVNALNGISNSVLSIPAALAALAGALGAAGSFGGTQDAPAHQYTQYSAEDIRTYAAMNDLDTVHELYGAAAAKNADPIAVGAAFGFTEAETIARLHQAKIPGYAIGSNFIERDQVAMLHQGEEVKPRAYVDRDRSEREETNTLLRRLTEHNAKMAQELREIRPNIKRIADITEKSDAIGPAPARAEA